MLKISKISLGVLSVFLASCTQRTGQIEVHISPSSYRLKNLESPLATPIAESASIIHPKKVRMIACRNTPPEKIIQLKAEMEAQVKAEFDLLVLPKDCS